MITAAKESTHMIKADRDKDDALRSLTEAFSKVSERLESNEFISPMSSSHDWVPPRDRISGFDVEVPEPCDMRPRELADDEGFRELLSLVRDIVHSFHDYVEASEKALKRRDVIAYLSLGVAALSLALTAILLLHEFGVL